MPAQTPFEDKKRTTTMRQICEYINKTKMTTVSEYQIIGPKSKTIIGKEGQMRQTTIAGETKT